MTDNKNQGFIEFRSTEVIKVKKEHFFDGMTLPVSVYLSANSRQYVLIGKAGDKAQFSQLASFSKAESHLVVLKAEYHLLTSFLKNLTEKAVKRKDINDERKVNLIVGFATEVLNDLSNKKTVEYQKLNQVSSIVLEFMDTSPSVNSIMNALAALPPGDARHGIATSVIAIAICDEMGITQKSVFEKIAFAALAHDLGLSLIPAEITSKPKHLWTPDDHAVYQQHPIISVEMLRDVKEVTNDILLAIVEHHENAQGTGYPKRIRDVKISPLGRILGVADYYAELLYGHKDDPRELSADEAIEYMELLIGQPFNKEVFRALKNIVIKATVLKSA